MAKRRLHNEAKKIFCQEKINIGAGIIAFWQPTKSGEPLVLLLRRVKPWDDWTFPKGGIEKGETPKRGALRECWEEAGIRPKIIYQTKPNIYTFYNDELNEKVFTTVYYFLAHSHSRKVTSKNSPEISERDEFIDSKWVRIKEALKMVKHETERNILREVEDYFQKHG